MFVQLSRVCCMSAEALAARTDVLELLELLRDAGARILPEVWHRVTSRYISNQSPSAVVIKTAAEAAPDVINTRHSEDTQRRR